MFLGISLGFLLISTVGASAWTWELFDEIYWYQQFESGISVFNWVTSDIARNGRFRPLIPVFNFGTYWASSSDPHVFKVLRALQFVAFVGVLCLYLRKEVRAPWLIVCLIAGYIVKSPTHLEQLRWGSVSELYGEILLLIGLTAYGYGRGTAYFLLGLAAITKEPFVLFLAVPALSRRRYREAFVALFVAAVYLGVLWIGRRGYSATYASSFHWPTIAAVFRGFILDHFLLVVFVGWLRSSGRLRMLSSYWSTAIFLAFGTAYYILVLPMATGYTYIQAPATLMIGIGLAHMFVRAHQVRPLQERLPVAVLVVLASIMPLRLIWNWTKVLSSAHYRHETVEALRELPKKGAAAMNCPFDTGGVGFLSGVRGDVTDCYDGDGTISACCRRADYVVLEGGCGNFDNLLDQAISSGLIRVFRNQKWQIFECRR